MIFDYFKNIKKEITDVISFVNNSNVFNGNIVNTSIDKNVLSGLNMGYTSDGEMSTGYSEAIEKLANSYKEITAEANAFKMAQDGLTESTTRDILAKKGYNDEQIRGAITSEAFKNAQTKSTVAMNSDTAATWKNVVATKTLSAVKKTLSVLGGVALSAAISIGISALVKLGDNLITTKKELKEASDTAKQSIKDIKSSFDSLKSSTDNIKNRYAELAQGVDQLNGKNLTLSNDEFNEFLSLSNQLSELFPSLTKNYDENGNAILNLSGNVNTIVSSLDSLIKKEQELANQKILDNMPDVYENFEDDIALLNLNVKKYQTLSNVIPESFSINNHGNTSFSLDDIAGNVVSGDLWDYLESEINNRLKENGFENAFSDVQFHTGSGYQLEIFGLENTEEYYEKLGQIYDNVRADVLGKIQETNGSIQLEMSNFNKYVYTWLSTDNWNYSQLSAGLQTAIQGILFNSNWINDLPDYIDSGDWNQVSEYLEEKYLKEINKINSDKYEEKLANLFTMDLNPQEKINLALELEEYFKQRKISIPLDFILDDNNQNSEQNLVDRMNNSITKIAAYDPKGYLELKEYTKDFSETQMNSWLEITDGCTSANEAMNKYKMSLKQSSEIDFFTDDNVEAIDEYKSKISDLSGYLEDIDDDGKLSADNISKLNTEYGIFADSVEEYRLEIANAMNSLATSSSVMIALKEAIESCDNAVKKAELQSLYDTLNAFNIEAQQSVQSVYNLEESVSKLESSATLLREMKELMSTQGFIDKSRANDILSVFPEMKEDVAKFNEELIDSEELFDLLVEAYEKDKNNYAKAIAIKNQYNKDYYDDWYEGLSDWVKDTAEAYGIDLANYKNLNEAKLALDKEYSRRRAALESALATSDKLNEIASTSTNIRDAASAITAQDNVWEAEENLNNMLELINAVEDSFTANVPWETFGKNEDKSGSDKDDTKIDWADQSLKVLQDEVDKLQTTLDNTKGLENQIEAIDNLNGALKKLKGGYKSAYDEYETRYKNAISVLGKDIQNKIESGEEFNLLKYDSKTAENVQTAIDSLDKMKESEEKIKELSNEIDVNENIEKSKLLQQTYERQLETINTKLEDQTLSADEKNILLKKQLKLQLAINDELRKQAKYEEDFETISKLNAEDKNTKLQNRLDRLQEKRDENQVYIDTYEEKLKDTTLTSEDINSLNNGLQNATNKDFKLRFKEKINIAGKDTWDDYIASLKEKYAQQYLSDKEFIKKHLKEISQYFSYTGMEELYYEYMNSERGFEETDYETKKNERNYHQNDINNNIQDIQNDIELQGGRGAEEQYNTLKSLYNASKSYWIEQKQDAEAMRDSFTAYTAEWDKWNNEAQECDDNINKCDSSIKDCQMSILKLPLNEVEDALLNVNSALRDINYYLDEQTDLISAATSILDNEIENQELLKETVQDQIDKLEKENELRQSNLNVQKAEYELEKLKNQKTSKVFKEGQGWVYESDQSEIRDAQYNYDNAVHEHKLALLNDQVKVFDEEIKRLNKIKKRWTDINVDAERYALVNKATAYDSNFTSKVLGEDSRLLVGIASNYYSLFDQKASYEDQQKDYTTLQDVINDTVEMYNLEAIGYEEAKQRIKNAIAQYYPEIVSNYENEEETLNRVAEKKLEDAGITNETSEDIYETVKKSNKKILKNYNKLVDGLDGVFEQLNGMLQTYSANTQTMVDSISASIEALRSQLAGVQSGVDDANNGSTNKDSNSSGSNKNKNKNNKTNKAGKSHSGLELGYIGEHSTSKDKEAFEYIALSELKDNEVMRVLQRGEAVLNSGQITQVMDNFRKLTEFKTPTIIPNNTQGTQSVSFNGDIIVQGIQDTNSFARAIRNNLPQQMLQELYK